MKKNILLISFFATISLLAAPLGQSPHIGYVYPAGGQAGTTVQVIIGGMNVKNVNQGMMTGAGVKVTDVHQFRPFQGQRLSRDACRELNPILSAIVNDRDPLQASKRTAKKILATLKKGSAGDPDSTVPDIVPGERLVYIDMTPQKVVEEIQAMSPLEFTCLYKKVHFRKSVLQASPAIDQLTLATIEISPDAKPGVRELRLLSPLGITNTLIFEVSDMEESVEKAHYGKKAAPVRHIAIPSLQNGQIMPGEVDKLQFQAVKGQTYTFELLGRTLVPFLGDAVPGWFQPILSIHAPDSDRMLAFEDDHFFNPDPILTFTAPETGPFVVKVRDAIYRGREDFVYRLKAYKGNPKLAKKPRPAMAVTQKEKEPNNTPAEAARINNPSLIAGSIQSPGDKDMFRFVGKKGEKITAEVLARRLQSPVDSLIKLMNDQGKVLAWNDDGNWKNIGTETHHADSYLNDVLPESGTYYLQVSDIQNKGGKEYRYYLHLRNQQPDFQVFMEPSAFTAASQSHIPITIHIIRRDGFDGPVTLAVKDGPDGLKLCGATVPPGVDKIRASLFIPRIDTGIHSFSLEATGLRGHTPVTHPVVVTDEIMQAFLWLHLVPSGEPAILYVNRKNWVPVLSAENHIILTPGSTKIVTFETAYSLARMKNRGHLSFSLDAPPPGLSVKKTTIEGKTISLIVSAAPDAKAWRGNLIIDCLMTRTFKPKNKGKPRSFTHTLGVLPAISASIVE